MISLPARSKYLTLLTAILLALILTNCQQDTDQELITIAPTITSVTSAPILSPAPSNTPRPTALPETIDVQDEPTVIIETPSADPEAVASASPTVERSEPTATPKPTRQLANRPDGALISVEMEGQVGILLDELPDELREQLVDSLVEKPDEFWEELARRQVRLTKRRLNFRNFVYTNRGQLPLPPDELWQIELDPDGPSRQQLQGHDLVSTGYIFTSTLLTDDASVAEAEPRLAEVDGSWNEPFVLPADPNFLLQRTGNACLNEAGFPPNSYDSENAWVFFDYTCQGDDGGFLGCHRTRLHPQSCVEALEDRVGTIDTEVRFTRIEWDAEVAEFARIGEVTQDDGPDLKVIEDDLAINRIIYRYFEPNSCALAEACISGSGWRRLLQFTATVHNIGPATLDIGPVVAQNPLNNLFQYNTCHAHYHFSDYGDFYFSGEDEALTSKQAFCVESTNRFSNNEWSPIVHDYTCRNQGVQAGWVDEYVAGLDCQWIDITDLEIDPEGSVFDLGFISNPDQFLCEGTPVLDDQGDPVWEETDLTGPGGVPLNRPVCDFVSDWDVNNDESIEMTLFPSGSFVTEPCASDQAGPIRNCDFKGQFQEIRIPPSSEDDTEAAVPDGASACEPGSTVQLSCQIEPRGEPQVLRLCDFSNVLGVGVGCTFLDSLVNELVTKEPKELSFTCPLPRDEQEPGGLFSMYSAPVIPGEDYSKVSCEAIVE